MSIPRKPSDYGVPIHPGEFLLEDFMKPLGLSANALAIALHVPVTRISEIIRQRRGITADTAMRLGLYFGTTADFWVNMQKAYELGTAKRELAAIRRVIRPAPRDRKTGALLKHQATA